MSALDPLHRSFLFPRQLQLQRPDAWQKVPGFERLDLTTDDGVVEAWIFRARGVNGRAPVVLFAHGNRELIDEWPERLAPYTALGAHLVLVEYRGYGRSAGKPSEARLVVDLLAVLAKLEARDDVDASRVVFHGRSIGGGVVCALARRRRPRALVLWSTFTRVADVAARLGVPRFLRPTVFDSESIFPAIDVPVLIFHGRQDALIPLTHAHALAKASGRAKVVEVDADHNSCPPDYAQYFREAEAFFRAHGILETSP